MHETQNSLANRGKDTENRLIHPILGRLKIGFHLVGHEGAVCGENIDSSALFRGGIGRD